MSIASASAIVGRCGVALIRAVLLNPAMKAALRSFLGYERAALMQAILSFGENLEQLDIASRFLDNVFALVRQETAIINSNLAVLQPFLDNFGTCFAANQISKGIVQVQSWAEKKAIDALSLITGKKTAIGDLNNLAYEVQRKVTLRRAANAGIVKLEAQLDIIDALIELIDNL